MEKSRVLVVEDNPEVQNYLVRFLQNEYYVLTAGYGEEGLRIINTSPPDIIIADIKIVLQGITQPVQTESPGAVPNYKYRPSWHEKTGGGLANSLISVLVRKAFRPFKNRTGI